MKTTKKALVLLTLGMFVLGGCANPAVVQERKVGDKDLTCEEILDEIAEAERFEKDANDEKGATGTNVAAAVFFWPALLATYSNVNDALDAARDRQRHLTDIYEDKDC